MTGEEYEGGEGKTSPPEDTSSIWTEVSVKNIVISQVISGRFEKQMENDGWLMTSLICCHNINQVVASTKVNFLLVRVAQLLGIFAHPTH